MKYALNAPVGNSGYKTFRDPVHGDIFIANELVRLLDTPQVQRLRGIKQLGTASYVYPGAVHTRFEHSLGTCGLASALLDILVSCGQVIEPSERAIILSAALLHDVGHIPFGHTIEDERRLFSRHDSAERVTEILNQGELGDQLRAQGITNQVCQVLTGQAPKPWWSEIISGTFCADLLDYLARDAFFCGLPGRYDGRLLRSLRVDEQHLYLSAEKDGMIREDVVSETINLLRLRYFLTERVFFHHTKTASGAMISRAVEQAIRRGLSLGDLCRLTDERLFALMELRYGRDPVVSKLMNDLLGRRIYKRAYVLTTRIGENFKQELVERYHHNGEQRREAEEYLAKCLKMRSSDLIVYCPASGMQLKEAEVRLKTSVEKPSSLASYDVPEVNVLREKHRNLWRFYVFVAPEQLAKAKKISHVCEEYFGSENHLAALQSHQLYIGL